MRLWKIYRKITQLHLLVPRLTRLLVVFVSKSALNLTLGKKKKISDDYSSFVKSSKDKISDSLDFGKKNK